MCNKENGQINNQNQDYIKDIAEYMDIVNFQLREPAANIFASLPLLAENINNNKTESAMNNLQNIYRKTYMILKSVNNMSVASRFISKKEFSKDLIDLSYLVKNSLQQCQMILPPYCKIDMDIDNFCCVSCNESVMAQGLFNLILNSIDYRKDDDVQINITLKNMKNRAVIEYTDNSVGIKPELIQDVFKPYFSKNPYDDGELSDCMGLGLFILKSAVEHAGGNILLTSQFGEGVKYIISIPFSCDGILKSKPQNYMLNRYSDMFVQLCKYCSLPDLY